MEIKLNISKNFGAYSIRFTKSIELPIAPFYGFKYFDLTNEQEIECNFVSNRYQDCTIYAYGEELCVDIRKKISKELCVDYLKEWVNSMTLAGFTNKQNDLLTITMLLEREQNGRTFIG